MHQPTTDGFQPSWDEVDDPKLLDHYPVLQPVPQPLTPSPGFERLSAEIRAMIYGYAIGDEPVIYLTYDRRYARDKPHPLQALLRVSKLVRSEALPLMPSVSKTKFILRGFSAADLKIWLRAMETRRLRKVVLLRIDVEAGCGRYPAALSSSARCKRHVEIDMRNAESWLYTECEDMPWAEGTSRYLCGAKTWCLWHPGSCITFIPACGGGSSSSSRQGQHCCRRMRTAIISAMEILVFHNGAPHLDEDMITRVFNSVAKDQNSLAG